jgi:hypothetical protein
MAESKMEPRAEAASVAWSWRDRAAREAAARAREARANRLKGLIGGAVGLAVAALFYFVFHREKMGSFVAGMAVAFALIALISPLGFYKRTLKVLDVFAHAVGTAITWVLMTILFYLVFLPAGLILRGRGKLGITRGADRRLPTYWILTEERERARTPESYRKQF